MTYQQPTVYYAPNKPPSSAAATAGFVFSLLWGFGLLSLIGIALGIVGLVETRGGRRRGQALAVLAVIFGIPGVIVAGVFVATWLG